MSEGEWIFHFSVFARRVIDQAEQYFASQKTEPLHYCSHGIHVVIEIAPGGEERQIQLTIEGSESNPVIQEIKELSGDLLLTEKVSEGKTIITWTPRSQP